jgi:hypothetical protein
MTSMECGMDMVDSQQSHCSSMIDSNISQTSEPGDTGTNNANLFIDGTAST